MSLQVQPDSPRPSMSGDCPPVSSQPPYAPAHLDGTPTAEANQATAAQVDQSSSSQHAAPSDTSDNTVSGHSADSSFHNVTDHDLESGYAVDSSAAADDDDDCIDLESGDAINSSVDSDTLNGSGSLENARELGQQAEW